MAMFHLFEGYIPNLLRASSVRRAPPGGAPYKLAPPVPAWRDGKMLTLSELLSGNLLQLAIEAMAHLYVIYRSTY
jgi:hypothetical protein